MKHTAWGLLARLLTASPAPLQWLQRRAERTPYFHIYGPDGRLYMRRWWLLPKWCLRVDPKCGALMPKPWMPFSIRLHHIMRPDADRHLHDHPFNFRSILLQGWYVERRPDGGRTITSGETYRAPATRWHRISQLSEGGVWSLFIMGRRVNDWGFLVDGEKVPWQRYLSELQALLTPTRDDVEKAYRRLASLRHPDKGGSNEAMAELNRARDEALEEIK